MASIRKHGTGWRAEVYRQGARRSRVLATKAEAKDWAARQEYLLVNADREASRQSFGDIMDRYAREVSGGKRGGPWEIVRLNALMGDPIAGIAIGDLCASDLAAWRDRRGSEVAPGTVRREMTLLSAVLTQARKEWRLISVNPMADVRKPASPPPRSRLVQPKEMERLLISAGEDLTNATARAFHAFRFACETAMRAGEILALRPGDVTGSVATLRSTKNGHVREVPLSQAARDLLAALPPSDPLFGLKSAQLDALWRKLRDRAGVEGLTFHDSRAAGTTMLARKVDVLTLARITGHRDIRMLMIYYRESAADLAKRLD